MSFFAVCPLNTWDCMVRKNRMKVNKRLSIGERLDSSRFSGQMSVHNKGIAKKDILLFPAGKDFCLLRILFLPI
jgi:hypothetical protein